MRVEKQLDYDCTKDIVLSTRKGYSIALEFLSGMFLSVCVCVFIHLEPCGNAHVVMQFASCSNKV